MNYLSKHSIGVAASLLLLISSWSKADPVNYTIIFSETTGPAGNGSFIFDDCSDVVICPSLSFSATFGPGLVFETTQLGGNALFLEAFFTGTLQPLPQGTNFDSADGLSLLSFVTTGEYCIRNAAGASGTCAQDPGVFATGTWSVTRTSTPVNIDIKPGSDPNCRGAIPVAILGSDSLDVTQVDPTTLLFEGLDVRERGNGALSCRIKDVNRDGYADFVCQYQDTTTEGKLTGALLDGTPIEGVGIFCVVH